MCLHQIKLPWESYLMPTLTRDEIEAAKSPRGGWKKATLAAWGVPWPPPKGWKKRLMGKQDASSATWQTSEGRTIPINMMTGPHLENAIGKLAAWLESAGETMSAEKHAEITEKLERLQAEQFRRIETEASESLDSIDWRQF